MLFRSACDKLKAELEKSGVEVLLDDRDERPGVKFNDADLIGIPFRVVVGDKNLANGMVEIKRRSEKENRLVSLGTVAAELAGEVNAEEKV